MLLWLDLHEWRDAGGMGIGPISWRDLASYTITTGEILSRDDRDAVRIIEEEFHKSREEADKHRTAARERIAASKARAEQRRRW